MQTIFDQTKIIQFKEMCDAAKTIAVLSHTNPDGDAIGSGLALSGFLRNQGYTVRFFVPNHFPKFLDFIPGSDRAEVFCEGGEDARQYVENAELIICCDFNQIARLERMTKAVEANVMAPKVLLDHHLNPPEYELAFSDAGYSSTGQMVYDLISVWSGGAPDAITYDIAMAIYVGIVTDTGNLSFGNLTPEVYRIVADLIARGVDPVKTNRSIFNAQSESRLRMTGYLISEKMKVDCDSHTAYITLTRAEKKRFNHQIGDTEGVVNMPLNIECVHFSVMFIEVIDHIKISFRSQGNFDVNRFAEKYFNGGGHKNASGGKFFGKMDEAVARFEELVKEGNHPDY